MKEQSNPFSTGAGGANFEQKVQAAFLTTMIVRGAVPCFKDGYITKLNLQSSSLGYSTDDFYAEISSNGDRCRFLAQIKHNITISDNEDFDKVINAFWDDFNDSNKFNQDKDKLSLIKGGLNDIERNHIVTLLGWAKSKDTSVDFYKQVERFKIKKDKLAIFTKSISKAKGTSVSHEELWQFLKCFYLIGYDFTNDGSVTEAGLISLINLAIDKTDKSTAKQVWNDILVSITERNPNAGSYTIDGIRKLPFYRYFNFKRVEPLHKLIKKLEDESQLVFGPLKNEIGGIHLDRLEIRQSVLDAVKQSQFVVITGEAGVGKSAMVKDVLFNDLYDIQKFAFKADQFSYSNLPQVLSNVGVSENIKDLFACLTLTSEKIFLIDSLEKLLEADSDNAFLQLLSVFNGVKDVKIICTCRQYAVELLMKKYGINQRDITVVTVPILNKDEISIIGNSFPEILPLLESETIAKLLLTPKYLEYTISLAKAGEVSKSFVSVAEFKARLWSHVVENHSDTRNGLPLKRNNAFSKIALKRAKKMTLFVNAEDCDSEALIALEKDGVIVRENSSWNFSPSHDLLEDWALVKHVQSVYENCDLPEDLFFILGNEPAIRRAFRLWVQDYLLDSQDKLGELVKTSISNKGIERYWADELLIAILKSSNCKVFFNAFESDLLAEDGIMLTRCIHLLNTACKETTSFNTDWKISIPVGSGWSEIILLIKKNIEKLDNIRNVILSFLNSWHTYVLFKEGSIRDDVKHATKEIAFFYLEQCEEKNSFWKVNRHESNVDILIGIVYSLAEISKVELEELLGRASNYDRRKGDWELHYYYEKLVDEFLSGVGNQNLAKALPDLIVKVAKKEWLYTEPEEQENDIYSSKTYLTRDSFHREELRWGLNDKMDFFPPGIYKVPVYNLLCYHPIQGIEFICDVLNYSIDFYSKAESQYKQSMQQIEIQLNNGNKVLQWGNEQLWCAYRGTSVSHYLIECILMSLEKYLLEVAKNDKFGESLLTYHANYLLTNSNNVSTTSVLCSVIMAYPKRMNEAFLPIISVPEFYDFDLTRRLNESQALAIFDNKLLAAQNERKASNALPHRKEYAHGLKSFIIDYQFRIGTLNSEIFKQLDKLYEKVSNNVVLEKWLMEVDRRRWIINEVQTTGNTIVIQPEYSKSVKEYVERNASESRPMLTAMEIGAKISEAYRKNESISLIDWHEYYIQYSKEPANWLYDKPVTLSMLGLTLCKGELDKQQRQWCFETITNAISIILQKTFRQSFELESKYNILEKDIALQSFSVLFKSADLNEEIINVRQLLLYSLIAPFHDHELNELTKYIQNELIKSKPDEVHWAWKRLVAYTQYLKDNPRPWRESQDYEMVITKEEEFLQGLIIQDDVEVDVSQIEFNIDRADLLLRAFTIIPWEIEKSSLMHQFYLRFINFLSFDLQKGYDYERIGNRDRKLSFRILPAQHHTAKVLMHSDLEVVKEIIDELVNPFIIGSYMPNRSDRDYFDYVKLSFEYVFEFVVGLTDTLDKIQHQESTILRLWDVIDYLNSKIPQMNIPWLNSVILMDLSEMENLKWKVLDNRRTKYFELIESFWISYYGTIIKVLSTFGSDAFLPSGLNYIKKMTAEHSMDESLIGHAKYAEKLIEVLYYDHLQEIKQDRTLVNNFIWLLNIMVEVGSSNAYLIRENVITYKTRSSVSS